MFGLYYRNNGINESLHNFCLKCLTGKCSSRVEVSGNLNSPIDFAYIIHSINPFWQDASYSTKICSQFNCYSLKSKTLIPIQHT